MAAAGRWFRLIARMVQLGGSEGLDVIQVGFDGRRASGDRSPTHDEVDLRVPGVVPRRGVDG